ncbi:Nickel insertion protein [Methanosarcina lacustris Z-7289]|uniref:Nickel insertion protein n=1 Tax=Methanosarcina lacustris Z-7289 TaxID=1434111 RepID=A0A0E3S9F8_9EURY|nr:zeta toxin family protein [Methanosarcina lacustris]AKB75798.1 Nickel insertion protein [Methanosarcina lacustris Z-7289]
MKIAVCGKGGSGKSTISALLAKQMAKTKNVLVLDTDESNYGLHGQLGFAAPKDLMEYFGGKQGFKQKQRVPKTSPLGGLTAPGAAAGQQKSHFFEERWGFSDLPSEFVEEKGKIKLMAIGKIHEFGEGCACPMGVLTREFLENLDLEEDDIVIVDTEAGVEHFGRGVAKDFDTILVVVDPSYESLKLSRKFEELGKQAGNRVFFVLNKVEEDIEGDLLEAVDSSKVAAVIPADRKLFKASLKGEEFELELEEIAKLADFLDKN